MFGNHVAHSERKARRTWLPNLQRHVYKSEILGGKSLRLKLTTEAMRNIDRLGGFDNYILKTSDILLGGPRSVGVELKKQMKEAYDQQVEQNRLAAIQAEFRTRLETAIKVATEKAEKVERENALKLATGNI
jgi:large subunit ribosomal protein L28